MSFDLTVIVPSSGRPSNMRRLAQAFQDTCTANTTLICVLDEGDRESGRYHGFLNGRGQFGRVMTVPRGRRGMVDPLNRAFEELEFEFGFAVGFMGDDHLPKTRGWDEKYLEELDILGTGIVYGDDKLQGKNIPTQMAMTVDIPRELGYMCPPQFQHLWVDCVWRDWGEGISRLSYLETVVVEHLHPLAGKAKNDRGYRAVNSASIGKQDQAAYHEYRDGGGLQTDLDKLRSLLAVTAIYSDEEWMRMLEHERNDDE